MINIVLDTNVYRSNPARDNLHFRALEQLSKAGLLCLHVPYVILREFQTQQRDIYSKDLVKAISGLAGLCRKLLDDDILERLDSAKNELEEETENILSNAEIQIERWVDSIGGKVNPLCLEQADLALEAYFQGKPPLKLVKNREDIPDSFIVQSILNLRKCYGPIHVVAGDKKVKEAFAGEEYVTTYGSLSDFIESDLIQNELKDVDLLDGIGPLIAAIQKFENDDYEISNFLSNNIGKRIIWGTFFDPSIPDDNHEATISSYGEAEDIELDFSEAGYYGNGQLGIPFKLKITVLADYYIFKSDYYCMDLEGECLPFISDHNDHYFEAEQEFELCVSGLVSIKIDRDNINIDEISESIVEDGFKIDEVTGIELCS